MEATARVMTWHHYSSIFIIHNHSHSVPVQIATWYHLYFCYLAPTWIASLSLCVLEAYRILQSKHRRQVCPKDDTACWSFRDIRGWVQEGGELRSGKRGKRMMTCIKANRHMKLGVFGWNMMKLSSIFHSKEFVIGTRFQRTVETQRSLIFKNVMNSDSSPSLNKEEPYSPPPHSEQ